MGMGMKKGIRSTYLDYLLEPMEKAPKNDKNNTKTSPRHADCSNRLYSPLGKTPIR